MAGHGLSGWLGSSDSEPPELKTLGARLHLDPSHPPTVPVGLKTRIFGVVGTIAVRKLNICVARKQHARPQAVEFNRSRRFLSATTISACKDGPRNVPSQETANLSVRTGRSGMRGRRVGLREFAADRPLRRTRPDLARPGAARRHDAAGIPTGANRDRAGPDLSTTSHYRSATEFDILSDATAPSCRHNSAATSRTAERQPASGARLPRRRIAAHAAARDHRARHATATRRSIHVATNKCNSAASADRRRAICFPRADRRPSRASARAHDARHAPIRSGTARRLDGSLRGLQHRRLRRRPW